VVSTSPSKHRKIRKAVFPAAGLGTRFLPATKAQPKEMLPLVDKPIIQYVIEEAVASGLTSIIIVTGRGKNAIEDHFDVSYELESLLEERGKTDLLDQVRSISGMINLSYVRQKETLGLGHAVLMAKELVGDEPFAVMLGDDIIDSTVPCMRQMVEVFEQHQGPVIAVHQVPRNEISAYGVIDGTPEGASGRVYRIRDMVEKPRVEEAPSDLAIIGRYILTPDIFDALESTPGDKGGEIQLTDGLRALKEKRPLFGYRFDGTRHDAGNKLGFLKATVEFALKREDLGAPFRQYLKSLKL
jgi:UTP--glucose-1-phosphate uridylyltransferase